MTTHFERLNVISVFYEILFLALSLEIPSIKPYNFSVKSGLTSLLQLMLSLFIWCGIGLLFIMPATLLGGGLLWVFACTLTGVLAGAIDSLQDHNLTLREGVLFGFVSGFVFGTIAWWSDGDVFGDFFESILSGIASGVVGVIVLYLQITLHTTHQKKPVLKLEAEIEQASNEQILALRNITLDTETQAELNDLLALNSEGEITTNQLHRLEELMVRNDEILLRKSIALRIAVHRGLIPPLSP